MPDIIEVNITEVNEGVTVNVTTVEQTIEINTYETHPGANVIVSLTEPNAPDGTVWVGPSE